MISSIRQRDEFFSEFVALLLELHRLIREGQCDADEADAVRDRMDYYWRHLTEEQISIVDGLSEDLYTIGVDRTIAEGGPEADVASFRAAVASENWVHALSLLRKNEDRLPPAQVAFLRGTWWANLGEPTVAIEFLRESSRLEPLVPMMEIWLLACMVQAGRAIDAVERAMEITQKSENPLLLLGAAMILSVRAGETDDASEGKALRQNAIRAGSRGLQCIDTLNPKEIETVEGMLVGSWLRLAMNYDETGQSEKAREACATALKLDPNNVDALMFKGWLNRESDPESASADFHKGLGQRLTAKPAFGLLTTTANALRN